MSISESYNQWASVYDIHPNRTRDMEALAVRSVLKNYRFKHALELGCGTGKNTEWLLSIANRITAVDFSESMIDKAREKYEGRAVEFLCTNVMNIRSLTKSPYDLVTFSLILEHIEDLTAIFSVVSDVIAKGGLMYIGELHPFRQYTGSGARFDTGNGSEQVTCYIHHVSDFVTSGLATGFELVNMKEFFDEPADNPMPRILSILLKKT